MGEMAAYARRSELNARRVGFLLGGAAAVLLAWWLPFALRFWTASLVWTASVFFSNSSEERRYYFERLLFHWAPALGFGLLILLDAGVLGWAYGVPDLFREDPCLAGISPWAHTNSPVIWGALSECFVLASIFTVAVAHDRVTGRERPPHYPGQLRYALVTQAAPMAGYVVIAAIHPASRQETETLGLFFHELVEVVLGCSLVAATWTGILVVLYSPWAQSVVEGVRAHPVAEPGKKLRTLLVSSTDPQSDGRGALQTGGGSFLALLLGLTAPLCIAKVWSPIVPAVALCIPFGLFLLLYFILLCLKPGLRLVLLGALGAWIVWANWRPDKHHFPGFDYEASAGPSPRIDAIPTVDALAAWKGRQSSQKPKVVVVATSGGAYRAAFFTAAVLDAIDGACADRVRLLTGASGGMVAAAYFAVLHEQEKSVPILDRMRADILEARKTGDFATKYPVDGDSLSPVAEQMMQKDLFSLFWPGVLSSDRGIELERQWKTLSVSFADLAKLERAGERPSLVLSPMMIESGHPLFVSNLDLRDIAGEMEEAAPRRGYSKRSCDPGELFCRFPSATRMSVATGVRMNASFPYVSPAVELPGKHPVRIVDAGYYDNYGVGNAVAILGSDDVRRWLEENTSGVIVVQIRAMAPETTTMGPLAHSFEFLTSPLEGIASARDASMLVRNDQALHRLGALLKVPVDTIVFQMQRNTAMSWYVTDNEVASIQRDVDKAKVADLTKRCADVPQ